MENISELGGEIGNICLQEMGDGRRTDLRKQERLVAILMKCELPFGY